MKTKKETIEIAVTSVLILVLIFAVSNAFRGRKKRVIQRPVGLATLGQRQPDSLKPSARPKPKDLESRMKELKWTRDPFIYTPTYAMGTTEDLKLDGIVWDKKSPKAMIGGVIVGVGERIGEYSIIGITPDSVILTDGENEIKLKL
jgi:hypothetical protein